MKDDQNKTTETNSTNQVADEATETTQSKLAERDLEQITGGHQQMPPLPPDPPPTHSLCPTCKVNFGTPGFIPCASCAKILGWNGGPDYIGTDGVFPPFRG